jgi:hypothetical protein
MVHAGHLAAPSLMSIFPYTNFQRQAQAQLHDDTFRIRGSYDLVGPTANMCSWELPLAILERATEQAEQVLVIPPSKNMTPIIRVRFHNYA